MYNPFVYIEMERFQNKTKYEKNLYPKREMDRSETKTQKNIYIYL